jgi:uncharacterized protein (TIGR00251 family)
MGDVEMPSWYRYDPARRCASLTLHVQPNARKSGFAGLHGDALKVRIASPATDNKANTELMALLGKTLGISKSAIAVRRGATSRRKVVEVSGDPELLVRIEALTAG